MAGRPLKTLDSPIVQATLDHDVARRTREYAVETGRSLSSILSEAVVAYFKRIDLIEAIDHDAVHARLEALAREAITAEEGRV